MICKGWDVADEKTVAGLSRPRDAAARTYYLVLQLGLRRTTLSIRCCWGIRRLGHDQSYLSTTTDCWGEDNPTVGNCNYLNKFQLSLDERNVCDVAFGVELEPNQILGGMQYPQKTLGNKNNTIVRHTCSLVYKYVRHV